MSSAFRGHITLDVERDLPEKISGREAEQEHREKERVKRRPEPENSAHQEPFVIQSASEIGLPEDHASYEKPTEHEEKIDSRPADLRTWPQ